jgi:hypothetical protein
MMFSDGPHIFYRDHQFIEKYYIFHPSSGDKEIREREIQDTADLSLQPIFHQEKNVMLVNDFPVTPGKFENVNRIAAFGDVHGEFELLVEVLINNHIIDHDYSWSFGDGHLVFCGDIFDRGDQVTECLWLIYSLEQQARGAGGMVHFLLGNHELMAMSNDYRYLSTKYQNLSHLFKMPYSALFGQDTVLGRWLRRKNAVLQVDNTVFVHAGLSPRLTEKGYGIDKINNYIEHYLNGLAVYNDLLLGLEGPFWFRGYMRSWAGCRKTELQELNKILDFYKTEKIVFAHTPTTFIQSFFNHLIAIDVALERYSPYEFLLIEDGNYWSCGSDGQKRKI